MSLERCCITGELVLAAATLLAPLFVVTYQHELWYSRGQFTVWSVFPVLAVTLRLVAVRLHGTSIGTKRLQFVLSGATLLCHSLFLVLWVSCYHSTRGTDWGKASGLRGLPGIFWFIAGLLMLFIVISFRVEDAPHHAELGKAQLDRLTVEIFPATRLGAFSSEPCVICLQEFGEEGQVRKLRCGHLFHDECVTSWILHAALGCPYRCPDGSGGNRDLFNLGVDMWEADAAPMPAPDPEPAPPAAAPASSAVASGSANAPGAASGLQAADASAGADWISVGNETAGEAEGPAASGLPSVIGRPSMDVDGEASSTTAGHRWTWSSASI